jgi:hypothetical protein
MKSIVLLTGAIAIFGAGFVTGFYRSPDLGAGLDTTTKTQQDKYLTSTVITAPGQIGLPISQTHRSEKNTATFNQIQKKIPENGVVLPSPAFPPPHERVFSIEEKAQWEAQQLEAKEAELAQLDAMIQSMQSAGLPEEQIKHFRELKEAQAKAPIPELQEWNPSLPERTPEELREDFAASLEQANLPEAQRKAMLETFSQQFEPTDGNLPGFSSIAPPLHEPQN